MRRPDGVAILKAMTRDQLVQRIRDTALLHGDFTLRSGRKSRYYLDKYLFETQPDILTTLGQMLAEHVDDGITRLAGAELGGIPLVTAASMASGLPSVLIRNQKKTYGTGKQMEGKLDPGDRVMIVEDIVTSGGQVLEAVQVIRGAAAEVAKIVVVIDREEGAREKIEAAGLAFHSLLTKSDLGIDDE